MNYETDILFSPSNVGFDIVHGVSIEPRYLCSQISIDGHPLLELVREFEKGMLKGTVDERIAGSYWYLGVQSLLDYLGPSQSLENQRVALLGCNCGDEDCWPLVCTICQQDDRIIWKDFYQPHRRNWNYSGFGPFSFRKPQFLSELDSLRARWKIVREENKRK